MEHLKDIIKGLHMHFSWFIWGLVAIGFIWALRGGLNSPTAHNAYIKPPAPLDTGEVYGSYYTGKPQSQNEKLDLPEWPAEFVLDVEAIIGKMFGVDRTPTVTLDSPLAGQLVIDGKGGAESSDPQQEYIRIIATDQASDPITITGLGLENLSSYGDGITIPRGEKLPVIGESPTLSDIVLKAGDRAIITTGASPIGYSFRINMCSGYLDGKSEFTPALILRCPDGSNCVTDESQNHTYNQCVIDHKKDADFFTNEWRIFLGQNTDLWRNSNNAIKLIDTNGKTISAITY